MDDFAKYVASMIKKGHPVYESLLSSFNEGIIFT